MRARIRRVRARTVFLLVLIVCAIVGLLIGAAVFVLDVVRLVPASQRTWLDRMGAWTLLIFPAVYGVVGGFFGAVAAVFYNVGAAIMGGVEVELAIRGGAAADEAPSGAGAGGREVEDSAPDAVLDQEAAASAAPPASTSSGS